MKLLKRTLFIVFALFEAFSVCFFFFPENVESNKVNAPIVLTVWQIDMFEGGKGSRKDCVLRVAKAYEKTQKSLYMSVIEQTVEGAEQKLSQGIKPDLISFSPGLDGVEGVAKILPLSDGFAGKVNGETFAVAWAYGGYFLISKTEKYTELFVSSGLGYNSPCSAAYLSGINIENATILPPEEAFASFLKSKDGALIGTQRDLVRAERKNLKVIVRSLENYTDLVQYMAITAEEKNFDRALLFLKYFLSESVNETEKLFLVSPRKKEKTSDNEVIERLLSINPTKTLYAFTSKEVINELDETFKNAKNKTESELKIAKSAFKSLKIN